MRRRPGGRRTRLALVVAALLAAVSPVATSCGTAEAVAARRGDFLVTEYFPVPERWFHGRPVRVDGLPGTYRQDFLWAPDGASMEFDGVTLSGKRIHLANDEGVEWVNRRGYPTRALPNGHWSDGKPVWRDAGWRNSDGEPTFPKIGGGWSNGRGVGFEHSPLRFAPGPSERFLRYWHTAAVDPSVIPLGSRIYIARFRRAPNHGWFVAQDTGSTIIGHQIDLYVPAPRTANPSLQFSGNLSVAVYPPRR